MTKLTKVQKIWQFINFEEPTRKELTCFILGIDSDDYDRKHRGHYGTNIAEWKRKGHIVVVNKRYKLTEASLKDGTGRMYIELPHITKEIAVRRGNRIHKNFELVLSVKNNEIATLTYAIATLTAKLDKINAISKPF